MRDERAGAGYSSVSLLGIVAGLMWVQARSIFFQYLIEESMMRTQTAFFVLLWILTPLCLTAESGGSATQPFEAVGAKLHGVWKQVDDSAERSEILEISATQCAVLIDGQLNRIDPVLGQREGALVRSVHGRRIPFRFSLEGETLTLTAQFRQDTELQTVRYQRLAKRPDAFDVKPVPLGSAAVSPERLEALQAELAVRMEKDQELRRKPDLGPDDWEIISAIDRDNVAYLKQLIADIGWIDRERFGRDAAQSAFLIVQHSSDLSLMLTALPLLEKEAKATGKGGSFALLYDRSQLRLGRKQRYGSQIDSSQDGTAQAVSPLEDPEEVDERRAELGMQPLAEYLEHFKARNGDRVPEFRLEF